MFSEELKKEQETKKEEQEKKKADDLWSSFLSDVGSRPKPKPATPSGSSLASISKVCKHSLKFLNITMHLFMLWKIIYQIGFVKYLTRIKIPSFRLMFSICPMKFTVGIESKLNNHIIKMKKKIELIIRKCLFVEYQLLKEKDIYMYSHITHCSIFSYLN